MPTPKFMVALHRHYWWTLGFLVPLASISLGLFIMLAQMSEKRTDPGADVNPLGWLALCVAVGAMLSNFIKLILDRAKEENDKVEKKEEKEAQRLKEEEEKLEVVQATLTVVHSEYIGHLTLGIRLYNSGLTQVNVRRVVLLAEKEDGTKHSFGCYCDGPLIETSSGSSYHRQDLTVLLEPKHDVLYRLTTDHSFEMNDWADRTDLRARVEIHSFEGLITTVESDEVKAALSHLPSKKGGKSY